MKLTKTKLQQIIQEEIQKIAAEGLGFMGHIPTQQSYEEEQADKEKGYQEFLKASGYAPRKLPSKVGGKPLMFFDKNRPTKEEYLKNKEYYDELTRSGLPPEQIKAAIGKK